MTPMIGMSGMGDGDDRERGTQLALLTPSPPPAMPSSLRGGVASAVELRLVTWNVQHAAPARARRQAAWLAGQPDADVAVLTEVKDAPGGHTLLQALSEYGYRIIVPTQPQPQADGSYMAVLATRACGASGAALAAEALRERAAVLPQRLVAARVMLGGHVVGVVGLYVPSRGPRQRRNLDKRAFQQAVSAYLARLSAVFGNNGGPVVVAGDLNVVEPDHQPRYRVFGDWEYRFYSDFAEQSGLVDAFRALHPGRVEHSWFGRGGNGYRFDHIFVSHAHGRQLQSCRYLHEPRLAGLSDHAAMAVTIALDPAPDADPAPAPPPARDEGDVDTR
jgi:exodeoxyribonuclease-3